MKRKICIVTGTRAEFGLLRFLMRDIADCADLELQIIVTAAHLSPEFGYTVSEVEAEGFKVNERVEMLLSSDTATGVTKSMGLGLIGFADAIERLKPDLLVILGDRFEIWAAAAAALIAGVPIAHLHGGETTEGAFDEALRHSITKMSSLHFVAAEPYRRRVIQLGELPDRVFHVGGLGVDAAKRIPLFDRKETEAALGFEFGNKNLLVTFHPVTLEPNCSGQQMKELLAALHSLDDTAIIFTYPNADTGSRELIEMIELFVSTHPNSRAYSSLGQKLYLSCLQFVDAVVGNSSSGLTEVPSFGLGTVNIGDRQKGRLSASSVIHCSPDRQSITSALKQLYDPEFATNLASAINPYGDGGSARRIFEKLRSYPLEGILKKPFHDAVTSGAAEPEYHSGLYNQ